MNRASWLPFLTFVACARDSDGGDATEREICRRAGEAITARTKAHAADRPRLKKAKERGPNVSGAEQLASLTALHDMNATFEVGVAIGKRCLSIRTDSPCAGPLGVHSPQVDDLDQAFGRLEQLVRGVEGSPPCGRAREEQVAAPGVPACKLVAEVFQVPDAELARVKAAWPPSLDEQGSLAITAHLATEFMGTWRAQVDLGLAVLPACAPAEVVRSCKPLRDGLLDSKPEDLVARVRQLDAAFSERTPCPGR